MSADQLIQQAVDLVEDEDDKTKYKICSGSWS